MLTYDQCAELTKRKPTKKLENNTYLETLEAGNFGVKLHDTYVVIIGKDSYELNTGGWYTPTTKDRINKYAPVKLYQERGLWYLYSKQYDSVIFHDGILVSKDGEILSAVEDSADTEKKKRKIDRMVSKYIKGFIEHISLGRLEDPSNGDCWGCLMEGTDKDGKAVDEPMGYSHYISHFEEEYYVPSLLWKAIQRRGNPGVVWSYIRSNPKQKAGIVRTDLQHFFSKKKVKLMELI